MAFSPDGEELALSGFDGRLALVDSRTGDLRVDRELDSTVVAAVSWTGPDHLVAGGQDGVLQWVDPADLRPTDELVLTPGAALIDIAVVPGTDQLAVTSEAGTVTLVDTAGHAVVGDPLGADGTQLQRVAVSPDGGTIAATSRDGALRLWERSTAGPSVRRCAPTARSPRAWRTWPTEDWSPRRSPGPSSPGAPSRRTGWTGRAGSSDGT